METLDEWNVEPVVVIMKAGKIHRDTRR